MPVRTTISSRAARLLALCLMTSACTDPTRPAPVSASRLIPHSTALAATPFAGEVLVVAIDNTSTPVLVRYDHLTGSVAGTIALPGIGHSVDITPDGRFAFVSLQFASAVAMVDLISGTSVATIPVGNGPTQVTVSPDGTRVFVGNESSPYLSIIDVASRAVVGTIPVKAEGIAFTRDGNEIYVASGIGGTNSIYVFRTSDLAVLTQQNGLACRPINVTMSLAGDFAAVTDDVCGQILIISTATRSVARVIAAPNAWSTAITPDGSTIYVTEPGPSQVQVFSVSSGVLLATIPVGSGPHELIMTPDGATLYVTSLFSETTSVIDVATNSVVRVLSGYSRPVGVVALPPKPGATPPGSNVEVQPIDATTGQPSPTTITFSSVTGGGTTAVTSGTMGSAGSPVSPNTADFKLGTPPTYYDVTTTAAFGGTATVCINYAGASYPNERKLRLLHNANGTWIDITTSLDVVTKTICGTTSSFSPFVVAQSIYPWTGFFAPVDNTPTVNVVRAGSGVPVKFSLAGDRGLQILEEGYPKSQGTSCDNGATQDILSETVSAGSSSLSYDGVSGNYTYVWKTDRSWTGCRTLIVKLNDGTEHLAAFKLTK